MPGNLGWDGQGQRENEPGRADGRGQSDRRVLPRLLRVGRRVRSMVFTPTVEDEVREELDFHVRMRARELEMSGMSPTDARRAAEQLVTERDRIEGECRALARGREEKLRRGAWLEAAAQDVRFAFRQLRREPLFATVAVVTLALGIGANTAVFSAVRGVLLRPLPYAEPGELVALNTRYLPISGFDIDRFPLSVPELRRFREESRAFEAMAAFSVATRTVSTGQGADPVRIGAAPRLEEMLFRIPPRDPLTLLLGPSLLLVVAALACWIPARRALRIAPTEALRED